jgi:hypothetical protein
MVVQIRPSLKAVQDLSRQILKTSFERIKQTGAGRKGENTVSLSSAVTLHGMVTIVSNTVYILKQLKGGF